MPGARFVNSFSQFRVIVGLRFQPPFRSSESSGVFRSENNLIADLEVDQFS
jgi:hypothetical protein